MNCHTLIPREGFSPLTASKFLYVYPTKLRSFGFCSICNAFRREKWHIIFPSKRKNQDKKISEDNMISSNKGASVTNSKGEIFITVEERRFEKFLTEISKDKRMLETNTAYLPRGSRASSCWRWRFRLGKQHNKIRLYLDNRRIILATHMKSTGIPRQISWSSECPILLPPAVYTLRPFHRVCPMPHH